VIPTDSERTTPALSVTTDDLTVSAYGVEADVRATGERLFVELRTVRDAVRLLRSIDGDPETLIPHRFLDETDLTVEVRVRRRTVASVGARATPGAVSQRIGEGTVELRPLGAVSALVDGVRSLRGAGRRLLQ